MVFSAPTSERNNPKMSLAKKRGGDKVCVLSVTGEPHANEFDSAHNKSRAFSGALSDCIGVHQSFVRYRGCRLLNKGPAFLLYPLGTFRRNVVSYGGECNGQEVAARQILGLNLKQGPAELVKEYSEPAQVCRKAVEEGCARTAGSPLTSRGDVNRQKPSHDRHCSYAEAPRPCAYRMTAARSNSSLGAECWKPHGFLSLACANYNNTTSIPMGVVSFAAVVLFQHVMSRE